MSGEDWIDSWVSTPQPAEPEGLVLAGGTLRQTVRVSVGGKRVRLRFSNAFGTTALPITAVSVAFPAGGRAGVSAIVPGSARPVSFDGRPSVAVPAGAEVASDPVDLDLPAGSNLTVTMHLADGQGCHDITSHPGSRTTSYLLAGDHVADPDLPGATPVDHWYFLCGVRVLAPAGARVAVLVGDSLTDGRGTTTNGNDRWPDRLFDRLQSDPDTRDVAVLSHGVGGGRLLDDAGLVAAALARPRLRWLLVFKGVNDLGTAAATPAAQERVVAELVAAYHRIAGEVGRHGVRVYGATLPPFGGHAEYDDPAGHRERARQAVNEWIRGGGRFDGVVDFDQAVRDPADPRRLIADADEGDHLHLNPTGYRALAEAVPTHLFRAS